MSAIQTTSITNSVEMPARRGRKTTYDFSTLTAINMSFGVKGRTARQLRTMIYRANQDAGEKRFKAVDVLKSDDPNAITARIFRVI